jgi:hypothetical protein
MTACCRRIEHWAVVSGRFSVQPVTASNRCLFALLCPAVCASALAGLNFLSVYAALSLAHHTNNSPGALALAAAAVGLGAFKVSFSNPRLCSCTHSLSPVVCVLKVGGRIGACCRPGLLDAWHLHSTVCLLVCLPADVAASVPWLPHLAPSAGGCSTGCGHSCHLV